MQLPHGGWIALELEPVEQELPHERVVGEHAVAAADRPQRQTCADSVICKAGRQRQGFHARFVELYGHARVDQSLPERGSEPVEDLLTHELEERGARLCPGERRYVRMARPERDAERPALCGREEPLGVRLRPLQELQQLTAFVAAEGKLRPAQLGQAAARPQLGKA